MLRTRLFLALIVLLITIPMAASVAQMAGSRGGGNAAASGARHDLPTLNPTEAEGYLTIEGTAELRVRPTQIRIVLAITSEGETAQLCQQQVSATVTRLRDAWKKLDLAGDKVAEDFIAVVPHYDWAPEKRNGREVLAEKRTGYRMQSNLHLAVPDEATAQQALTMAFEQGVTDIIAFDYGNPGLDALKEKARAQALQAAKAKADFLLGATFKDPPPAINVQEQTTVHYPESLYESFTNVDDQQVSSAHWNEALPRIHAHRPKNTYYRGLQLRADVQPGELPMHAEITIVSTVRLYYASPAADKRVAKK